jgi:hypothetical protein
VSLRLGDGPGARLSQRERAQRCDPRRGAIDERCAALDLPLLPAPRAIHRGTLERRRVHDLVDETGTQRPARVAAARVQDLIERAWEADETHEALRATGRG